MENEADGNLFLMVLVILGQQAVEYVSALFCAILVPVLAHLQEI